MTEYLVTGGEGFIGGRIAQLFGATSYDLKSGEDILDAERLSRACANVAGIFHCAARISVPESFERSEEYYRVNVEGTHTVIRVAELHKAKIVFSSSAAVYGEKDHVVHESEALDPLSPYADNKQEGERLLQEEVCPSAILRYFNVYGPKQSSAYAGVITAFIRAAMNGEDLIIYGNGEQIRDFVFVDDVARANIAALESEYKKGEVFNIASGIKTSINELAEEIIRLTNSASRIIYTSARPGDITYSQADVGKAEKLLGWKAETELRDGLKKTIESYKQ